MPAVISGDRCAKQESMFSLEKAKQAYERSNTWLLATSVHTVWKRPDAYTTKAADCSGNGVAHTRRRLNRVYEQSNGR